MELRLENRVAIVTGAAAGLGRGIARALAAERCRLALVDLDGERLAGVAAEIAAEDGDAPLAILQDVTEPGAAIRIREDVLAAFGAVDVLINNAGTSCPFADLGTPSEWEASMRLNFSAGRDLAHALVPDMRRRRFGRIVNVTGADEPTGLNAAMPPNGAVNIWAKGLSRVVGRHGITVNCVSPGRIHSEQIDRRVLPTPEAQAAWVEANCPAGYIGEPEDLAVLVAFLCSPRARYITGQVIYVDGGVRRFPH